MLSIWYRYRYHTDTDPCYTPGIGIGIIPILTQYRYGCLSSIGIGILFIYRVYLDLIHFAMAVQSGCYFWVVVLIFQEVNTLILNAAIVVGGTLYYCDGLNSSVGSSISTVNKNYNTKFLLSLFLFI